MPNPLTLRVPKVIVELDIASMEKDSTTKDAVVSFTKTTWYTPQTSDSARSDDLKTLHCPGQVLTGCLHLPQCNS